MNRFYELFKEQKAIIGMVHLLPLPGSPGFKNNMDEIYEQAIFDAKALEKGGASALMVENFGDMPYPKKLSLEQATALAAVASVVKQNTKLPIGIDAAFCDYESALACAKASKADFIRLAVFVDTVESFAGILEPCASQALKYRKQLEAEDILIFADIQVKHSHMLMKDIDITESAKVAVSCGADAVIVTGAATGMEAPIDVAKKVKDSVECPVIIGSGIKKENVKEQMAIVDGAIVGSSLKMDNIVTNKVDENKVREIITTLNN